LKLVLIVCGIALIIDFIVWAMCKAASKADKDLERPWLIRIRGDKK